jgi:hypothetical protein
LGRFSVRPRPARGAGDFKKKGDVPRTTYLPFFAFFANISMVLLSSSCRETAKNTITKLKWKMAMEKIPPLPPLNFWGKISCHFFSVSELFMQRNDQKRDKKTEDKQNIKRGMFLNAFIKGF